jgi:uncharacterized protein (TIGR02145 family)
MKKIILNFLFFGLVSASAQVGIGTATPETDAILELSSPNKALLLPRVANTAAVASPINGMMIYDISSNCVKGFENGSWSGCISSATGGGSGNVRPSGSGNIGPFDWETSLRFLDITTANSSSASSISCGIATNKCVYCWGSPQTIKFPYPSNSTSTAPSTIGSPVYLSVGRNTWDGKAKKIESKTFTIYVLDEDGNVWVHGSRENGKAADGVYVVNPQPTDGYAQSVRKPSGVTKFLDFQITSSAALFMGDNGRVYICGVGDYSNINTFTLTLLPNPTGTPAGFSYTKIFGHHQSETAFLLGSDGNLYSYTNSGNFLWGNQALSGTTINYAAVPLITRLVNLPAGVASTIEKINYGFFGRSAVAITNTGQAYFWGVYNNSGTSNFGFLPLQNPALIQANNPRMLWNPALVSLPAGETAEEIQLMDSNVLSILTTASGKTFIYGLQDNLTWGSQLGATSPEVSVWTELPHTKGIDFKKIEVGFRALSGIDVNGVYWAMGSTSGCVIGGPNCNNSTDLVYPTNLVDSSKDASNTTPNYPIHDPATRPSNPRGIGKFQGRMCFDLNLGNNSTNGCKSSFERTARRANFTLPAIHTQQYTFTPQGTVSNVRFVYQNVQNNPIIAISGGNSGTNITTPVVATVNFDTELNTKAAGRNFINGFKAEIYVIYNDGANNDGTDRQIYLTVNVNDCGCCGANVASASNYREFMCYNLGADEVNTSIANSSVSISRSVYGGYWQWGYLGPDLNQGRHNTPNFAHNRFTHTTAGTAPLQDPTNSAAIAGWNTTTPGAAGRWSDTNKTINDPCPGGYRIPTKAEWDGVIANNTTNTIWGTASFNGTADVDAAIRVGDMVLPAVGHRVNTNGSLTGIDSIGYYWSSTQDTATNSFVYLFNQSVTATSTFNKLNAASIRCIAEN